MGFSTGTRERVEIHDWDEAEEWNLAFRQHLAFLSAWTTQSSTWGTEVTHSLLQTQTSAKLCKQEGSLNEDVSSKLIFPSLKIKKKIISFSSCSKPRFKMDPFSSTSSILVANMRRYVLQQSLPSISTRGHFNNIAFLKKPKPLKQNYLGICVVT